MVTLPDISKGMNNIIGYALVIAGVLSAAFYVVVSSRFIKYFDPVTLLSGQLIFFFVLSSIFVLIAKPSICLPLDSVVLVFLSGVLQYFFLAFCFYLNSLRWLPVHIAGAMLYFIPLVALFLSWLFLDETFTFIQGGVIVTVFSVYSLNKKYSES